MKANIQEGLIIAIYDNIAERLVSVFYARNMADAHRYVKANFSKAEPIVREGLVLTVLLDIQFYRLQNPGQFEAETIDEVLQKYAMYFPGTNLGKPIDIPALKKEVLGSNYDDGFDSRTEDNDE